MKQKIKLALIIVAIIAVFVGIPVLYSYVSSGSLSVLSSSDCSSQPLLVNGVQVSSYQQFRQMTSSTATDQQIMDAGYSECSGGLCSQLCSVVPQ